MRKARRKWVNPPIIEDDFTFKTAKERDRFIYGIESKKSVDQKLQRKIKPIQYPKINTDVLTERVKYLILTGEIKVYKSLQEFKKRKCNSTT